MDYYGGKRKEKWRNFLWKRIRNYNIGGKKKNIRTMTNFIHGRSTVGTIVFHR